jgi:hypothetical protein
MATTHNIRHLYVNSDSAATLREFISQYGKLLDMKIYSMKYERPVGGFTTQHIWLHRNTGRLAYHARWSWLDAHISSKAAILIGSLSSNWCRFQWELRSTTNVPVLVPFVDLDLHSCPTMPTTPVPHSTCTECDDEALRAHSSPFNTTVLFILATAISLVVLYLDRPHDFRWLWYQLKPYITMFRSKNVCLKLWRIQTVIVTSMFFLVVVLRYVAGISPSTQLSSWSCHDGEIGGGPETRQCVATNAFVAAGRIYMLTTQDLPAVPDVLCSNVNSPPSRRVLCPLSQVRTPPPNMGNCVLSAAVPLYRLTPNNVYHIIYEDLLPAYSAFRRVGVLNFTSGINLLHQLTTLGNTVGVTLLDDDGDAWKQPIHSTVWSTLLPEVRLVYKSAPCAIQRLFLGSRVSCVHWIHCQPPVYPEPQFQPASAALELRALTAARLGFELDWRLRRALPRVTIVQRSHTRRIANVVDVEALMRAMVSNFSVRVVDLAKLTFPQQLTCAAHTDLFVLVHGAALGLLPFLAPGAMVIDIYPYGFPFQQHVCEYLYIYIYIYI